MAWITALIRDGDRHGVRVGTGGKRGLTRENAAVDRGRLRRASASSRYLDRARIGGITPDFGAGRIRIKSVGEQVGAVRPIARCEGQLGRASCRGRVRMAV